MWEILGGLLIGTAVSGIVPLVNAEVLVAAAALALPAACLPAVALVSTVGQMSTKSLLYGLARWAPARLPARARSALERAASAASSRGRAAGPLIFSSAAVGLPPFYGVALACGALKVRPWTFVLAGAAGRAVRFGVVAWTARLVADTGASIFAHRVATALLGG